jgi:hypothetical protein
VKIGQLIQKLNGETQDCTLIPLSPDFYGKNEEQANDSVFKASYHSR